MSFGYHSSLKSTLLETLKSQYEEVGTKCVQCYIGGNQTYKRRDFSADDLRETSSFVAATGFRPYIHATLCMNLASGFQKNVDTLREELKPMLAVGGSVVVHIGSKNVGGKPVGTMDKVIQTIKALNVKARAEEGKQPYPLLIENAAGQGSMFGSSWEDLQYLFAGLRDDGVGLCFDTAHAFGAGIATFDSEKSILATFDKIDEVCGKGRFQLLHLNDSKIGFGGKNDRHECLGQGYIWQDDATPLKFLLRECQRRGIDVVLETPDVVRDYQVGCSMLREAAGEEEDAADALAEQVKQKAMVSAAAASS